MSFIVSWDGLQGKSGQEGLQELRGKPFGLVPIPFAQGHDMVNGQSVDILGTFPQGREFHGDRPKAKQEVPVSPVIRTFASVTAAAAVPLGGKKPESAPGHGAYSPRNTGDRFSRKARAASR